MVDMKQEYSEMFDTFTWKITCMISFIRHITAKLEKHNHLATVFGKSAKHASSIALEFIHIFYLDKHVIFSIMLIYIVWSFIRSNLHHYLGPLLQTNSKA